MDDVDGEAAANHLPMVLRLASGGGDRAARVEGVGARDSLRCTRAGDDKDATVEEGEGVGAWAA